MVNLDEKLFFGIEGFPKRKQSDRLFLFWAFSLKLFVQNNGLISVQLSLSRSLLISLSLSLLLSNTLSHFLNLFFFLSILITGLL